MQKVNWGIIGPGWIANKFADAVKAVPNANLIACASRDIKKANDFKEKYNLKYAYGNYEEMLGNPEIDAVYIATTHNFHYENMKLCLNNNKHILCEKSFTVNAEEAREVADFAREKNLFAMEAMWTRFLPATRWVCEQISNCKIGTVYNLKANFGYKIDFNENSRAYNPDLAGGGLLDLGIYPVSYASMIFGYNPTKITSIALLGKTGVDEHGAITLLYKTGAIAELSFSMRCNYNDEAIIYGTNGRIEIPNFYRANNAKLIYNNGETEEFIGDDMNGFIFEIKEATDLIQKGEKESRILPLDETVEIIRICDKLRVEWGLKYPNEL